MPPKSYSFSELCQALRKPQLYVRNLQAGLDLTAAAQTDRYPEVYFSFLFKVAALRTAHIGIDEIRDLFLREKRIQEMLHVDTLSDEPYWYLYSCDLSAGSESRLFLTGYDLGHPVLQGVAQAQLNFEGTKKGELFSGAAMGEDLRSFCRLYWKAVEKIKSRIAMEKTALRAALNWLERVD